MAMCVVCSGNGPRHVGVAEMTTGKERATLCDGCRPLVVTFFHVHGGLHTAIREARVAYGFGVTMEQEQTDGR